MTSCFSFSIQSLAFHSPHWFPLFPFCVISPGDNGASNLSSVLLLLLLLCQENGDEKEPYQTRDSGNKRGRKSRSFFVCLPESGRWIEGSCSISMCVEYIDECRRERVQSSLKKGELVFGGQVLICHQRLKRIRFSFVPAVNESIWWWWWWEGVDEKGVRTHTSQSSW